MKNGEKAMKIRKPEILETERELYFSKKIKIITLIVIVAAIIIFFINYLVIAPNKVKNIFQNGKSAEVQEEFYLV